MPRLIDHLDVWRRQRAWMRLREETGWLFCALACLLTVWVWTDALVMPSRTVRAVVAGATAAGFSFGCVLLFFRFRRRDWPAVIEGAVHRYPELGPFLLSAWDLSRKSSDNTSPTLAAAHVAKTEALLAVLPEAAVFSWKPFRGLRFLALAALFGASSWPWVPASSWERVLIVWREVSLEQFLALEPGDAIWTLGQPATITVRRLPASGSPKAADARLWIKTSGSWRSVTWDRANADQAALSIPSVAEPISYRATWKGIASRTYRLEPRPLPRLESLRASVSGETTALIPGQALRARRGGWVRISGRPNQPLSRLALRGSFLPGPVALSCDPSGECQAGFFARQDGSFEFDLETPDGRRDPAPVSFALQALPDEPPAAELLSPQIPIQASHSGIVPVAYSAKDDSGISRAALLVRAPGRPQSEITIRIFGRQARKEFVGDYAWELSGLPVGSKVQFQVKVWDDAVPAQSGLSEVNTVEIVDFESGHKETQRLWSQAEQALERLAGREEKVRDLYGASAAEQARGESAALPQAWKEAAASAESLAKAMAADAYANPGLAEQFSEMAEDIRQARDRELAAAQASERAGDLTAAREGHGRLVAKARRARRALEKAKAVQGLQDFYHQAGAMSQDGERISSALESLSQGSSADQARAVKEIQGMLERLRKSLESLAAAIAALPPAQAGGEEARSRQTYSMPLLSAQTSADALRAALRSGDLASAAKIAQELARQLSAVEAAVTAAASAGAASASRGRISQRMERLRKLWAEVIEQQSRLADVTQGFETKRLERFVAAQKELLASLAKEQGALISSAAARGQPFSPRCAAAMKAVEAEFSSGQVKSAPGLCAAAAAALRAAGLPDLASAQDALAAQLAQAPAGPPIAGPNAETTEASQRQAQVRRQTAGLQADLEALEEESSAGAGEAVEKIASAQVEQGAAESDLDRGDTASALAHQQKALSYLESGNQAAERSASSRQSIELGISGGFSRPASGVRQAPGGGSGTGARLEFVPLPSAKDYQPPREIRQELERSLNERRPPTYDPLIKEYFKRLSQ
jgi:hypothetical protein